MKARELSPWIRAVFAGFGWVGCIWVSTYLPTIDVYLGSKIGRYQQSQLPFYPWREDKIRNEK
ncbi:uncharacterized protein BDW47DRAFT_106138 [Aspergillus candidus]|uniref:Uncharacterized protein n=1 Tax=Aspergillus candidus TaxID=41067 RepID=A0A2I2FBF8_ASPCN|nr:hypothetical protein BDW47DRAFT_106138 [Aspergillus candidus]PLB37959.1 hypothetical protein BDW47DRAFT_106138 [Aspergillus candidus]